MASYVLKGGHIEFRINTLGGTMKGKHKLLSLVLTALLSFGIVTPHVVHAEPVSNTISIIYTNDVHGRLDGDYAFARF